MPTWPSERAAKGERVILVREETTPEDFHGIVAARARAHRARRHDEPRGRRGARHGQVRDRRLQGDRGGRGAPALHRGRRDRERGRLDHARRRDRTGVRGRPADGAERCRARDRGAAARGGFPELPEFRAAAARGRTACAGSRCAPTPTRRTTRASRANFGAEGIGLCRTEHMFFEGDRITAMREMIVARDEAGRRRALAKLLPMQRGDFEGIFEAMDGLPGHDPAARPAAARVPAARRRGREAARAAAGAHPRGTQQDRGVAARVEPDARAPRLPARDRRIPRSPRCRRARSSRRRCAPSGAASTCIPRSWCRSSRT